MRKIILIVSVILAVIQLNAQSVHQMHQEYFSCLSRNITTRELLSIYKSKSSSVALNKIVFGYLPDWEYAFNAHKSIKYDLLSHLAVFPFSADANGNLTNPVNWPWTDVINACKSNNVKLIASIANFNGTDIHSLFTDRAKKNNLIANIAKMIQSNGFAGVNIDFENINQEDRSTAITNFFADLREYLKTINKELEISFASPAVNWGGWDFLSIAQNCDYLFIMGYEYYGSWSATTGPSSPLEGTSYNLTRTITSDYASLLSTSPQKLILGVPYYGNYWKTKTGDAYTAVDTSKTKSEYVQALRYKEIIPAYQSKTIMWDNLSKTRWLRWQDETWNQVWYDDDSSLSLKYDLAIKKNLGGIGIWALGYDDGRSELWNLIEKKFTGTVDVKKEEVPSSFQLYQNYPNPFNPSTIINYSIAKAGNVKLKVYDLLGREVATLVDEFKPAGNYNSQFSIVNSQLSSGVYFYTLTAGSFIQTKKMLLTK